MEIPDLPEPITAYKQLNFDPLGRETGAWFLSWNDTPWTAKPMKAACIPLRVATGSKAKVRDACAFAPCPPPGPGTSDPKPPGHYGHGCGIYAYKSKEQIIIPEMWSGAVWGMVWPQVATEVLMWGKVYEYTEGYRAEYCQIKTVYLPMFNSQLRAQVSDAAKIHGFETEDGIGMYDGYDLYE